VPAVVSALTIDVERKRARWRIAEFRDAESSRKRRPLPVEACFLSFCLLLLLLFHVYIRRRSLVTPYGVWSAEGSRRGPPKGSRDSKPARCFTATSARALANPSSREDPEGGALLLTSHRLLCTRVARSRFLPARRVARGATRSHSFRQTSTTNVAR